MARDSSSCWEGLASRKWFGRDFQLFLELLWVPSVSFFTPCQELGHAGGSFTRVIIVLNPFLSFLSCLFGKSNLVLSEIFGLLLCFFPWGSPAASF